MSTDIKDVTVQFVCNSCKRENTTYLGIDIDINALFDRIMNRTCLSCRKGKLNISHIKFYQHDKNQLIGKK